MVEGGGWRVDVKAEMPMRLWQCVDGGKDGEPGNGVDVVAAAAAVMMVLVVTLELESVEVEVVCASAVDGQNHESVTNGFD